MKIRRARELAAKAYADSDSDLASAALAILKHHKRRDRVAEGLAAFVKGGGRTYYVDATLGSDSNDGSVGAPWKTAAKVNASTFSPGDTVRFKAGEVWRETLLFPSSGSPGRPITIGKYGTGANPVFNGADVLVNANFTNNSGATYQISHTAQDDFAAVWESGVKLIRTSSLATCQATAGSSYYNATTKVIYVHSAAGDPNPATNGLVYEASKRGRVLDDNTKSWLIWEYLEIRQGWSNLSAHIILGDHNIVRRCAYYECANHSLSFYGGYNLGEYCTSDNNAGGAFLFYSPTSQGNLFRNLSVTRSALTSTEGGPAVQTHGGAGSSAVNIVEDSVFDSSCTAPNNTAAIAVTADLGTRICARRNYIKGKWIYAFRTNVGGAGSQFLGNCINGTNITGRCVLLNNGATGVEVYGNTYFTTGTAEFIELTSAASATMKNNIVVVSASAFYVATDVTGLVADNNLYYGSTRGSPFNTNSGTKTLAQWKALGFDANGVVADPLLTNAAAGDFSLQAGSPANDTGANLGSDYATALLAGTSWPDNVLTGQQGSYGAGWEIGAFIRAA